MPVPAPPLKRTCVSSDVVEDRPMVKLRRPPSLDRCQDPGRFWVVRLLETWGSTEELLVTLSKRHRHGASDFRKFADRGPLPYAPGVKAFWSRSEVLRVLQQEVRPSFRRKRAENHAAVHKLVPKVDARLGLSGKARDPSGVFAGPH